MKKGILIASSDRAFLPEELTDDLADSAQTVAGEMGSQENRESRPWRIAIGCLSVRRFPIESLVLQGDGRRKLRLYDIQLCPDLAALADVARVTKLGSQFLDLDFNVVGHRLISLSVKDDVSGREGMAGSGIAQATGRAGEWGSRFSEGAAGGWRKLGEPLILEAGMRERQTPGF